MMYLLEKTWLLILCVAIYLGLGLYNNNFYRTLIQNRAQLARQNSGHLHVAIVEGNTLASGFLTGAEVAAEDLNQKIPGRVTLTEVELSRGSDSAAELASLLQRDMSITAVVAEAPDLPNQLAVICESYGVGLLLVNPDPSFLASPGFRYVVKVGPRYATSCQAVIEQLGLVTGKPKNSEIRIGLFFDQSTAGVEELVNTFAGVNRAHNDLYRSARAIQRAVDQNLIKADQPLDTLDDALYVQTGVTVTGATLRGYLENQSETLPGNLTTQQALDQIPALKSPVKLAFVRGFQADSFDPGQLAVVKSQPPDCVIVISALQKTRELLSRLRSLQVSVPIVCLDCKPVSWVESNLGPLAQGLYMVSLVNPSRVTPEMQTFRDQFGGRAARSGRSVKQPDLSAVLAYDTITTLSSLVTDQGTTVPLDLMTLLQLSGTKWSGLEADHIAFASGGVTSTTIPVLVTVKDGNYLTVK